MGYYTDYSLKIESDNPDPIYEAMEEDDSWSYGRLIKITKGGCYGEIKWYGHEKEMKVFSKRFPETLFILEGLGENNDDMWAKYFKNGKMQVCKATITYDEFDEKKLK